MLLFKGLSKVYFALICYTFETTMLGLVGLCVYVLQGFQAYPGESVKSFLFKNCFCLTKELTLWGWCYIFPGFLSKSELSESFESDRVVWSDIWRSKCKVQQGPQNAVHYLPLWADVWSQVSCWKMFKHMSETAWIVLQCEVIPRKIHSQQQYECWVIIVSRSGSSAESNCRAQKQFYKETFVPPPPKLQPKLGTTKKLKRTTTNRL